MKSIKCHCGNSVQVANSTTEVTCSICLNSKVVSIDSKAKADLEKLLQNKTTKPVYARKRWTPEEDQLLVDNVKTHNIPELMNILKDRSAYAVEQRIWTLKVDHIAKQKYVG